MGLAKRMIRQSHWGSVIVMLQLANIPSPVSRSPTPSASVALLRGAKQKLGILI